MLYYILKGFIIGLSVSIPLGPMGILCIQKTISKGKASGFMTGLGAGVADTCYAILAILGITFIINFIKEYHIYFQLSGGLFLIYLGTRIFLINPIKLMRNPKQSNNLLGDFLSTFVLTISNPFSLLLFGAIFAGLGFVDDSFDNKYAFLLVLGVFAGALTWWYFLSTIVNIFRHKIRLRRLNMINKTTGVVIFIFGIVALLSLIFY